MTRKLLSDEELRLALADFTQRVRVDTPDGYDYKTYVDFDEALSAFNTQKRLYAEMVVGERKQIPSGPHASYPSAWIDINNHIVEQRARIK